MESVTRAPLTSAAGMRQFRPPTVRLSAKGALSPSRRLSAAVVFLVSSCLLAIAVFPIPYCQWSACQLAACAASSVPEMEEQFVYGLTMWGGLEYLSGFVPEQISEIHMIAGADNVLAPFRTMVYFWPITGEYMADWATKREPVTGVLEVLKEGRVIESIPLTRFTLRYPEGFASPIVELLTGDEAVAAYEEYRKAVEDFNEAAAQYERARREHDARISEMFRAMRGGGKDLHATRDPEPPAKPVPPSCTCSRSERRL